ncbi:hypothetical protein [Bifidobacterium simiarum]|uniref:hypothetical protein n=1 Tax=Bifidobacterium simiarum TaxID=2045441 RepID=UPI001BDC7A97|nr:hypothetical protein [Bifidobacterium simiarum]MBT1166764.1 hypothetical protein [Bifidobacterium simiarum]
MSTLTVTVPRNNEPVYSIINEHDYRHFRELEDEAKELRNAEARRQTLNGEYTHSFKSVDDMDEYFDAL